MMRGFKSLATFSTPVNPEPSVPSGVVIDGAVYPLEGQPPIAVSHGWGDLSFLFWRK